MQKTKETKKQPKKQVELEIPDYSEQFSEFADAPRQASKPEKNHGGHCNRQVMLSKRLSQADEQQVGIPHSYAGPIFGSVAFEHCIDDGGSGDYANGFAIIVREIICECAKIDADRKICGQAGNPNANKNLKSMIMIYHYILYHTIEKQLASFYPIRMIFVQIKPLSMRLLYSGMGTLCITRATCKSHNRHPPQKRIFPQPLLLGAAGDPIP